jgi:hypothetical protein
MASSRTRPEGLDLRLDHACLLPGRRSGSVPRESVPSAACILDSAIAMRGAR